MTNGSSAGGTSKRSFSASPSVPVSRRKLRRMCLGTIYPSGLCLVMEILRGFGSQISDRDAQSPRTSRDIVLCHPQALQEGRESIVGIQTREYRCSLGGLANRPICAGKEPSRARDRTTWLSIIHFTEDCFPLHGAHGRSRYYVGAASRIVPKIQGRRAGT